MNGRGTAAILGLVVAAGICGCGAGDGKMMTELQRRGIRIVLNEQGEIYGAYLYQSDSHPPFVDDDLQRLKDLTSLRILLIESDNITDDSLDHLTALNDLEELDLTFCNGGTDQPVGAAGGITDRGLEHLKALKQLKRLGLEETRVTDDGVERLQQALPNCEIRYRFIDPLLAALSKNDGDLKSALELVSSNIEVDEQGQVTELALFITDVGMKYLADLTEVKELVLRGNYTDAGLSHLGKMTKLETLDLSVSDDEFRRGFGRSITNNGLNELIPLENSLKSLDLRNNNITDAGLKRLETFSHLEKVVLKGTGVSQQGVKTFKQALPDCLITFADDPLLDGLVNRGDDLLAVLRSVAHHVELNESGQVVSLSFRLSAITDQGLQKLKEFPSLERLSFTYCRRITDTGLDQFGALKNLKRLVLSNTNVTGTGLRSLRDLTRLTELDLTSSRRITDVELQTMIGFQVLNKLVLQGTSVTNLGLQTLAQLTTLKTLDLRHTAVTEDAVEYLREQLKNCKILYDVPD